jgi:adenylate cyclase
VTFGEPIAGLTPWTYAAVSASLAFARARYAWYVRMQLALSLVLPFLLQLVLGGFVPGSAVMVWAFLSPLGDFLVSTPRVARGLLAGFLALVVVAAFLAAVVAGHSNDLPDVLVASLFVLNLSGTATVTYIAMLFFIKQRDRATAQLAEERARSERLLLNVLPAPIAARLKSSGEVIADRHVAVTVLCADIVGFTPLSTELEPEDLVALLDEVVSGSTRSPRPVVWRRSAPSATRTWSPPESRTPERTTPSPPWTWSWPCGLTWRSADRGGRDLVLRVGIASGPAVAGTIGHLKFQHDIWGDTVTTASRMESDGLRRDPGHRGHV